MSSKKYQKVKRETYPASPGVALVISYHTQASYLAESHSTEVKEKRKEIAEERALAGLTAFHSREG